MSEIGYEKSLNWLHLAYFISLRSILPWPDARRQPYPPAHQPDRFLFSTYLGTHVQQRQIGGEKIRSDKQQNLASVCSTFLQHHQLSEERKKEKKKTKSQGKKPRANPAKNCKKTQRLFPSLSAHRARPPGCPTRSPVRPPRRPTSSQLPVANLAAHQLARAPHNTSSSHLLPGGVSPSVGWKTSMHLPLTILILNHRYLDSPSELPSSARQPSFLCLVREPMTITRNQLI